MLARIDDDELVALMRGYGHEPHVFVAGFDDESHTEIHRRFATMVDTVLDEIAEIKARAASGDVDRPRWPMIVFRTPKGWTGPDYIDGKKTTGSWRAHQVPLANARDTPSTSRCWTSGCARTARTSSSTTRAASPRTSASWHRPASSA